MILQELYMNNFCQHRQRTFEFSPRLNLIIGPNGSGKTNMLRAMQLALTGAAGGSGQKLDDIAQAGSGSAGVTLTLEHAGDTLQVHRGLRPNTNNLHINGQLTCRTVAEIASELEQRLGTTKQQICDYIFVKQRGIDAWLDKRDADRAKELGELFHLDAAETIWQQLGIYVSGIELPLLENVAEKTSVLHDAVAAHTLACTQLAAYADVPVDVAGYVTQQMQILQAGAKHAEVAQRLQAARTALQVAHGVVPLSVAKVSEVQQQLASIATAYCGVMSRDTIGQYRQQWAEYNAEQQMLSLVTMRTASLQAAWQVRSPRPVRPFTVEQVKEATSTQRSLDTRLTVVKSRIRELTGVVAGVLCPLCKKPTDDPAPLLVTLQKEQDVIASMLLGVSADIITRNAVYETECHIYKDMVATTRRLLAEVRTAKSKLKQPEYPKLALDVLTQQEEQLVTLDQGERLFAADLARAEATLAAEQQAAHAATAVVSQLEGELAGLSPISVTEQQRIERGIQNIRDRAASRDLLTSTVDRAALQVEWATKARDAAVVTNTVRERRQGAKAHLETLRDIFHRNELPRMVSYTYLERMQTSINDTLELFEAPFRVTTSEELGFDAHFDDGRRVADRRLSVGERIVLAMAFRMAINTMFASSLGVLIMDEPTAGLDEHNLGCLPRALERLRVLSDSCGLQVLFVTHEPRISYLFDRVIDLTNAS